MAGLPPSLGLDREQRERESEGGREGEREEETERDRETEREMHKQRQRDIRTVGVTEKLLLPFCNYCSNGGKTVNCVLFDTRRSNIERARRLNIFALINGVLINGVPLIYRKPGITPVQPATFQEWHSNFNNP